MPYRVFILPYYSRIKPAKVIMVIVSFRVIGTRSGTLIKISRS